MFTYCPNCATVFQVSANLLSCAAGKVRCGECRHVYVATDYLFDDAAQARAALDASTGSADDEITLAPVDYVRMPDVEQPEEEEDTAPARPGPAGWERQSFSMRDLGSGLGIVCLLLLLGVQWIYFNRTALAADSAWRPTVERLCAVMQCTLPLRADIEQLVITNRDVRQHPTIDQALLINASFENRADFIQPFPVFEISFTDKSGDPVAIRRFLPAEYLTEDTMVTQGLPADIPVQVVLEVMDPGDEAVSFQFGFL